MIGKSAFAIGCVALMAMLVIDISGAGEVRPLWFASLAMVLTVTMWLVPSLRPDLGRRTHG